MDVEKTMDFILAQMAEFASMHVSTQKHLDQLQKHIDQLRAGQQKNDEQIQVIVGAVHALIRTRDEDRQLIERERLRAEQERLRMDALSDKIDQTTENVNALVKIVDGMIRRNGGQIQ